MIRLVGIGVVALGFALRWNPLLVVAGAAVATGLAAGMSFNEVMGLFGELFIRNRFVTLTAVLMLPVVGLLERHGLRERAETLIGRARSATAGRILLLYTALRQVTIALGVSIGGHASVVRPLLAPMAEAAAEARTGPLDEEAVAAIRAHAAAGENVGSFFGEDTVFAAGAVLMIQGILEAQGIKVGQIELSLWGIPTAGMALVAVWWRMRRLDRRLAGRPRAEEGPGR